MMNGGDDQDRRDYYSRETIEFYKELKARFYQDDRDKFDEFYNILVASQEKRIDFADFVEKVKKLFEGHKDLILRINIFLPKEYKIKLPVEDEQFGPKSHVGLEDARNFLIKVKAKFQGVDDRIYNSFIEILNLFHQKRKSFTEVCQEVTRLFQDHPYLLYEFTYFLPKATQNSIRRDIYRSPT